VGMKPLNIKNVACCDFF